MVNVCISWASLLTLEIFRKKRRIERLEVVHVYDHSIFSMVCSLPSWYFFYQQFLRCWIRDIREICFEGGIRKSRLRVFVFLCPPQNSNPLFFFFCFLSFIHIFFLLEQAISCVPKAPFSEGEKKNKINKE